MKVIEIELGDILNTARSLPLKKRKKKLGLAEATCKAEKVVWFVEVSKFSNQFHRGR